MYLWQQNLFIQLQFCRGDILGKGDNKKRIHKSKRKKSQKVSNSKKVPFIEHVDLSKPKPKESNEPLKNALNSRVAFPIWWWPRL